MRDYKVILFDLDGTLTDPKIGITKSVQYALQKRGVIEKNLDKLEPFIGPPLQESFANFYSFDEDQIKEAIQYYREYFKEKGMFENIIYPDIPELLLQLKQAGKTLVVATSKPTVFSEQILEHFSIHQYFDLVVGSNLDGTRSSKTEIIDTIHSQFHEQEKSDFIMIGDREYDVIGANNVGIDSIGVTYGYGSLEELRNSNPTNIASTVLKVKEILMRRTVENESSSI